MDKFIVKPSLELSGEVEISCAKNAYLPIMAGVLLTDESVMLKKIPNLKDISTMNNLLELLGVKINKMSDGFEYTSDYIRSLTAPYELVRTMRASILLLGPLLTRFHEAKVSLPGGCAIGQRPIDIHLDSLKMMGADITIEDGYVIAKTGNIKGSKGLVGAHITFPFPSVGATENLLMAAVLAKGLTVLENVALEPEISDLSNFLNSMGAKIVGIGTATLKIMGVEKLHGTKYTAIGDRIEAGTFINAALMTNSNILLKNICANHLESFMDILRKSGAKFKIYENQIRVLPSKLKGFSIDTAPYPGFPTDLQAQMMSFATVVNDSSIISEHIFENRFMHVPELVRLGANIVLKGNSAFIKGGKLKGAEVMCTDLRASAALVLAGLVAENETIIRRVYHIDRGYDGIEKKLSKLGALIKRVSDSKDKKEE